MYCIITQFTAILITS